MPITIPDIIAERGKADAKRHREKQKEVLKKNLPKIVANEAIITGKKDKTIKILIKSLQIPYFKPGGNKDGIGIGQGEGEEGDITGKRSNNGKSGHNGDEPDDEYIETEVELAEIIELMLEDLGLPKLEEKEFRQLVVELGYKIKGRSASGPWALLDARTTAKEGIKRFWVFLRILERQTGLPELTCFNALKKASGIVKDALEILKDPDFKPAETIVQPFPIIDSADLRFHKLKPDMEYQSQAVILAIMDVSGSMGEEKKYLARSMLFWMVSFLRKIYEKVEIRFIIHHATAKIVDEERFFSTMEGGSTYCYTGYELANGLIDTEYPTEQYNVYVLHFSDGEDYDTNRAMEEVKKLFSKKINMLGYGEIDPLSASGNTRESSSLMKAMENGFGLKRTEVNDMAVMAGATEPFLAVRINKKEHILPALKEFLKKDRWANG